jgi:hypothetical protein
MSFLALTVVRGGDSDREGAAFEVGQFFAIWASAGRVEPVFS